MAAPATSVAARTPRPRRWAAFFGVAAVVIVLDQVTKAWVDGSFALASPIAPAGQAGGPTQIVGDLVRIAKTYNDGGIFGLLGASAPFLGVASLVVIAVIVVSRRARAATTRCSRSPSGCCWVAPSATSSTGSRFGHVIDFVDMGIGGVRWYTFNVADAAISIAIVLLVVIGLFGRAWDA